MKRLVFVGLGIASHTVVLAVGFVLGIYYLPILMARPSPDAATLQELSAAAVYSAEIVEDLPGNDFLHWGTGTIRLTPTQIIHQGQIAPGPDYVVYLVPECVTHEDEFLPIKGQSQRIGRVDAFDGFALSIPGDVNIDAYTTVLVWCETFGEFILAARYR